MIDQATEEQQQPQQPTLEKIEEEKSFAESEQEKPPSAKQPSETPEDDKEQPQEGEVAEKLPQEGDAETKPPIAQQRTPRKLSPSETHPMGRASIGGDLDEQRSHISSQGSQRSLKGSKFKAVIGTDDAPTAGEKILPPAGDGGQLDMTVEGKKVQILSRSSAGLL